MAAEKVSINYQVQFAPRVVMPAAHVPGSAEASRTVALSEFDTTKNLNENSTPAPKNVLPIEHTLTGGTDTIDLTAAAILGADSSGAPASSEDLTGEKVIGFQWLTPSANTGAVTIEPAGTNGYPILGSGTTGGKLVASKDASGGYLINDAAAIQAVDATHKIIEITGTSGDVVKLVIYTA